MATQVVQEKYDDQKNILAFILKCGKSIYSYSKLKIGVYALSEGGRIEDLGLTPVFSYKFPELSWDGPYDREFETDLFALCATEILLSTVRMQREGFTTKHSLFELGYMGVHEGVFAKSHMTADQRKSLEQVAEDVKKEENSFMDLYEKYASEWDKQATKRIKL
jgi:hypothetical protein